MREYFEGLDEEDKKIIRDRDILIPEVTGKRPLSKEEEKRADEKMREVMEQFSNVSQTNEGRK